MTEIEEGRLSEKVDTNARDIGKLWASHRELSVVVQGTNGDNGLRSNVRDLESWKDIHMTESAKLRADITHYKEVEHPQNCFGLKALDEHLEQHVRMLKEAEASRMGKLKIFAQTWGQLLQFAGITIGALISAYVALKLGAK